MNPSGDYGKKELSPALRNRFTEIWVEPITHPEYIVEAENDILEMVQHKLSQTKHQGILENIKKISKLIFDFLKEYNCVFAQKYGLTRKYITMRDIGWICKFMCECD
jgi:midasin (ATPase involved in ribosome maturation)